MTARDNDNGVGRVLGTQHTSTREFRVVLDDTDELGVFSGNGLVVARCNNQHEWSGFLFGLNH